MFSLKFRNQLVGPVRSEFDQLVLALRDFLLVAHDQDGNITAQGLNITDLNASNLTSGAVPIARISGLADAQIAAAAAIAWSKISKAGSSLADLATRDASALNAGTIGTARLGSNVADATVFLRGDQTWQRVTKGLLSGRTTAGIAAAVTTYLGLWDGTTETDVYLVSPVAGVVRNLYVQADGTAGVGQSFTYTVRKNAVDQTVTCSVSGGTAVNANDATHSFSVAAGDLLTVKLVTSAAASVRKHQFGLEIATA